MQSAKYLEMNRIRVLTVFAIIILCACAGCSQSVKSLARERIKKMNEATDLMKTITDRASYEAAKPKLKRYYAWRQESMKKGREQEERMSAAEKEKLEKEREELKKDPEFSKLSADAVQRHAAEFARILSMPEIGEQYMKEVVGEGDPEP